MCDVRVTHVCVLPGVTAHVTHVWYGQQAKACRMPAALWLRCRHAQATAAASPQLSTSPRPRHQINQLHFARGFIAANNKPTPAQTGTRHHQAKGPPGPFQINHHHHITLPSGRQLVLRMCRPRLGGSPLVKACDAGHAVQVYASTSHNVPAAICQA